MTALNEESYLVINDCCEGFRGMYFGENIITSVKPNNRLESNENYTLLKVLTGVPEFGVEVFPGELVNNTYFEDCSVNYHKGCYPGQETVAKIHSRRGAAFKPVLVKIAEGFTIEPQNIYSEDKRIGDIRSSCLFEKETYLYVISNSNKASIRLHIH